MPSTAVSFTDLQRQFTRHIRDPDRAPAPPGIEERRLAIYRNQIYRNVEDSLANSFPVLRRILKDEEWHPLMRDYFKRHRARAPLFPKMPQEFLRYLQDKREEDELPYPFIRELAHYEWVETALTIDSRVLRREGVDADGDLLAAPPVLSELIWPLTYAYPAHRIGPDYLPLTPPERPTYLLVYRDRQDAVGFMELNPVAARLLDCLKSNEGNTGRASCAYQMGA